MEFDLNKAIAGYPVYTRSGKRVEITSFCNKLLTCDVFYGDMVITRFYPRDGKYYFPDGVGYLEDLMTVSLSDLIEKEFEK